MATSQNKWLALPTESRLLVTWTIPARNGSFKLRLRTGSAGFLLAFFALWYAETIEPVAGKILDDWGWAWRPVRGQTSGLSNHASGTAMDLNALTHGLGRLGTLAFHVKGIAATVRIAAKLLAMGGVIRAGEFYKGRRDPMHYEINVSLAAAEKAARKRLETPRGKRILTANPGQRKIINSN